MSGARRGYFAEGGIRLRSVIGSMFGGNATLFRIHNLGWSMNRTEQNSTQWVTPAEGIFRQTSMKIPLRIGLGSFILWGRVPLLHLKLIELMRDGTYLTFPDGTEVTNGGIYFVVRPLMSCHASYLSPGKPRKVVATVRVVKTTNKTRALVTILSGSLLEGTSAEKATQ